MKEFDAYIADELPAYILVMLDNKKPWKDITQELEVFLVESTEPFVEWLKGEVDSELGGSVYLYTLPGPLSLLCSTSSKEGGRERAKK